MVHGIHATLSARLVKRAAGRAVQEVNTMLGLPEAAEL
jgi:N-acetyl-gamma-glutamylphosphate reductase